MIPDGFNWLDIVIGFFLVAALVQGIRIGLIKSIFSIAGIIMGLAVASSHYADGSTLITSYINMPQLIADVASFIVIFSFVAALIQIFGSFIAGITRFGLIKMVDKIGGSVAGLVIGLALAGVILIMLTAFPLFGGFNEQVEGSYLAEPIVDTTFAFYEGISEILPYDLPQLTMLPEELGSYFNNVVSYSSHSNFDFETLDGATCFVCGAPVEFIGYLNNNKGTVSPKFICTDCGRTSDGCQTYEGYHGMYEKCPVVLGNQGYRLDCGIWNNNSYLRPTGPCVVCGTQ